MPLVTHVFPHECGMQRKLTLFNATCVSSVDLSHTHTLSLSLSLSFPLSPSLTCHTTQHIQHAPLRVFAVGLPFTTRMRLSSDVILTALYMYTQYTSLFTCTLYVGKYPHMQVRSETRQWLLALRQHPFVHALRSTDAYIHVQQRMWFRIPLTLGCCSDKLSPPLCIQQCNMYYTAYLQHTYCMYMM